MSSFIEQKIDHLLLMMEKSPKYGQHTLNHGIPLIMFSQDYIDVVEIKRMLVETGRLPLKQDMIRMNEIFKDIQMTENDMAKEMEDFAVSQWKINHGIIETIKELRQRYSLGLKEAKDITDRCLAKGLITR